MEARYVILGAGGAGLSLCHALLARGVTAPIVILDPKPRFDDDRTWCFWDTRPNPFLPLSSHGWHEWGVRDASGKRAVQTSSKTSYRCLRGRDFYDAVLFEIRRHPNVTLCLGDAADSVTQDSDGVTVRAGQCEYRADYVFDSRPPRFAPTPGDFVQRFRGRFVRANRPVFTPARCTLMDFEVDQTPGPHFVYVLPFTDTHALVEDTYLLPANAPAPTADDTAQTLEAYLAKRYPGAVFVTEREEAGAIPMTTRPFPKRDGRVLNIGTAGGCTKPSSGYTFARIQEQCRQIADAAAAGTLDTFREQGPPPRFQFFDAVFLQALRDNPAAFPGYFQRLFARVSPEALTRFLSETSTWRDEFQVVRGLPALPFLKAARRRLLLRG